MTAENENRLRTEISFFDNTVERRFLINRDPQQLYESMELEPESIVKTFHELWRNYKDLEIYQVVLKEPALFVQNFVGTGDFTEGVKNLHVNLRETLDNCDAFSMGILILISKAARGLSFDYPEVVHFEEIEMVVNSIHNTLVEAKKEYLLSISHLN